MRSSLPNRCPVLDHPRFFLNRCPCRIILVSMTRKFAATSNQASKSKRTDGKVRGDHWALQDAMARFSELVRRVHSEGPQHVTLHGRPEVVVIAAEDFHRLTGAQSGAALISAMQASPHREVELESGRMPMPVRDVIL